MELVIVALAGILTYFFVRSREKRQTKTGTKSPQRAAAPRAVTTKAQPAHAATPPTPPSKALLIKIDTRGMSKASIAAIEAASHAPRSVEPADARTLRRFIPHGADIDSYPITCPHCGWCEMFDGKWAKQHHELTCSRCDCRTILYKSVSPDLDPTAITSLREHEIAFSAHPEEFRKKWMPHGPGKTLRKGLTISAHIKYNGINGVIDDAITIKSLIGFELTSGFKVTAFTATQPGQTKSRKFSLWQIEAMHDGRNGAAIPIPEEWLCGETGLPLSPD